MNTKLPILEIKNLKASIEDNQILKTLNLKVNKGEIYAIMGPNGSGKSTLSKVIAGHPAYTVNDGDILFSGESILTLEPEERSHLGIFLAFQYPIEIPGVSNEDFLYLSYNSKLKAEGKEEISPIEFFSVITEKLSIVDMSPTFFN
jgi:Fe-S cluster assembly ATP-binding protein